MAEVSFFQFLLILFLVFLNGFFVASEFAFVKVRMSRITELMETGSRRAKRAAQIVKDLDRSLSSTQLGITLASIALGFVGEPFFSEVFISFFSFIEDVFGVRIFVDHRVLEFVAFITGYLIVTFMHVVIGELAPKSISIQFAERTALICAEPLYWFMVITDPLLKFFVWSSNGLLAIFSISPAEETHKQTFTENELKIIIEDSIQKGEIEEYESKLIFNILDFTDSNVKSILTPRIDIEALPVDCSVYDLIELSIQTGYSRIPIYEESLDDVIGFIHIKDIVAYANGYHNEDIEFNIKDVLRPVIIVPEGKPLDDLLKEMQQLKTQVAVIVDEYGSVEGIVTIEDIIEAIFGPIEDEFDQAEENVSIKVIDDKIIAGGLISIDSFNSTLQEKYSAGIESSDSATLAGYVLELFESEIPHEGMVTNDGKFEYKISQLSGNRIEQVEIKKYVDKKK